VGEIWRSFEFDLEIALNFGNIPDSCKTGMEGFEEFSQHESLTTRLRNVLSEYPLSTQTLCEFLQNADDAKATSSLFCLCLGAEW